MKTKTTPTQEATMTRWIAITLAGRTVEYASPEALNRARRRRKDGIVDSWPANDPAPTSSDAREWDAWRTRQGYSGTHH